MKEKTIRVLKVEPGKRPETAYLENGLAALQRAVSIGAGYTGLIEIVGISETAAILCNEEGKLIGLKPNRRFGGDILCGVFYIAGQGGNGELASLSEGDTERYSALFAVPDDDITPEEVSKSVIARVYSF